MRAGRGLPGKSVEAEEAFDRGCGNPGGGEETLLRIGGTNYQSAPLLVFDKQHDSEHRSLGAPRTKFEIFAYHPFNRIKAHSSHLLQHTRSHTCSHTHSHVWACVCYWQGAPDCAYEINQTEIRTRLWGLLWLNISRNIMETSPSDCQTFCLIELWERGAMP